MPTPKTGAITLNDINVEIKRGTSATTCSLNDVRTRTGFTGAISFSDLRGGEGALITGGVFTIKGAQFYGFNRVQQIGTVTPAESNGYLQFATNSFFGQCSTTNNAPTLTTVALSQVADQTPLANGTAVTTGFKTTDINYIALGGASRTITSATSTNTTSTASITYGMPTANNATTEFFIRFA